MSEGHKMKYTIVNTSRRYVILEKSRNFHLLNIYKVEDCSITELKSKEHLKLWVSSQRQSVILQKDCAHDWLISYEVWQVQQSLYFNTRHEEVCASKGTASQYRKYTEINDRSSYTLIALFPGTESPRGGYGRVGGKKNSSEVSKYREYRRREDRTFLIGLKKNYAATYRQNLRHTKIKNSYLKSVHHVTNTPFAVFFRRVCKIAKSDC
jgi:hypothetical protein